MARISVLLRDAAVGLALSGCAVLPPGEPAPADPSLLDHYRSLGSAHPVSRTGGHIHDPSRIVTLAGFRMIAVTGKEQAHGYRCGLEIWYMPPGATEWSPGQCLLTQKPGWTAIATPDNDGAFWAPTFGNSPRRIYYTVSNMSPKGSTCIGMLNGTGEPPSMHWLDVGRPVACFARGSGDGPGIGLDPAYFEANDGTPYLVFGGFDIWVAELDRESGFIRGEASWRPGHPGYHHVATLAIPDAPNNPDGHTWSEAAYVHPHDGYYYLFVNWGFCCRGLASTYEIRVGRASHPAGPYFDRDGLDLRDGGGTLFVDRAGAVLGDDRYVGPGHPGTWHHPDGRTAFSFHYYDRERDGVPWIGVAEIVFVDGWPALRPPAEWIW